MNKFRISHLLAIISVATVMAAPASATIIFAGQDVVGGAGFGNLPRALTIQSHGPSQTTEMGCIAPNGSGGLNSGSGACGTHDLIPLTGGDEAPPISFPKQAAPTLSSLGITSGNQIGILFDAVQPQSANNATVTINDLTLKLYNGTSLVFSASNAAPFVLPTNPGNGNTDYLFTLDATQAAAFNAALAGNTSDTIALDSEISFPNQSAGPDSYALINLGTTPVTPVPEPVSLLLICSGLLGLGIWGRKRVR